MTATQTPIAETARKAAAAAYEALPAILLAAALLMPAIAAIAAQEAEQDTREQARAELRQVIAAQGNQALLEIRAEAREHARENVRASIVLPKLP